MVRRCFPVAKTVGSSPIAVDFLLVAKALWAYEACVLVLHIKREAT